jgi:hypothetical protein
MFPYRPQKQGFTSPVEAMMCAPARDERMMEEMKCCPFFLICGFYFIEAAQVSGVVGDSLLVWDGLSTQNCRTGLLEVETFTPHRETLSV